MSFRTLLRRAVAVLALPAICFAQPGVISTIVGTGSGNYTGDGGPALKAGLGSPVGLAMDSSGNLFILIKETGRVRRVTPAGLITTYAGNGTSGFAGDGGPATSAELFPGNGIAVDGSGNLYIADSGNNRIRTATITPRAPSETCPARNTSASD